jgi:phage nucleotide-binding protein
MAVALIYSISGGGKTVNSTRVAGGFTTFDETTGKLISLKPKGKNLLLSSDNSHIVLNNFERPNLDVQVVKKYLKDGENVGFIEQFENAIGTNKYDTVICDNISTLFDTAILEMAECGKYKDMRNAYQTVYMAFKRLIRKANLANCNVIFTAWCDYEDTMSSQGEMLKRTQPKLPIKILDSFCGLCNIVGQVARNKNDEYGFMLEGTATRYAKDQIYCRKSCKPEELFTGGKK